MISRRAFFTGILCLAGHKYLAGANVARARGFSRQSVILAYRISGLFRHIDSAIAIGEAYLETHPFEANLDVVAELLAAEALDPSGGPDTSELSSQIVQARQRDFDRGRITWVRGLALSRTEALLCAIVALYAGI